MNPQVKEEALQLIAATFGEVSRLTPQAPRREFGVPPGGPFDLESATLARLLLDATDESPIWELGLARAQFQVPSDGTVAVVGANSPILLDGQPQRGNARWPVRAGSVIECEPPTFGCRLYLSYSQAPLAPLALADVPASLADGPLRAIEGPQPSPLPPTSTVSHLMSRVGVRMQERLELSPRAELTSEPACPGAIQLTPLGELIVIGPEGPTIGGYPKIAVVASVDLDRIGQLRPGQSVRWQTISLTAARELLSERVLRWERRWTQLRLAQEAAPPGGRYTDQ